MTDLIRSGTRGQFRSLMTETYLGEIDAAFQDEGIAPNPDSHSNDSSQRRSRTQAYLETIAWNDRTAVERFLRVVERLLVGTDPEDQYVRAFYQALRRDGYERDDHTGQIIAVGPRLLAGSLANLRDPSAIQEGLDRIRRAIVDDPAQAVGSAKELIESTAKVVLAECGQPVDEKADLPKLARSAQLALGLDPSTDNGPDGSDGVRRILGAVTTIAGGLAELRNRGYGTGHGPATARVSLRPRHAHLAVNAATTWCQLMLDTLADPDAPWRRQPS